VIARELPGSYKTPALSLGSHSSVTSSSQLSASPSPSLFLSSPKSFSYSSYNLLALRFSSLCYPSIYAQPEVAMKQYSQHSAALISY
jgi:hypothetical protein